MWDVLARDSVLRIAHDGVGGLTDVAFIADGKHLVLSDSCGALRWIAFPIPHGDLRAELCRAMSNLGRRFSDAQMQEFSFLWSTDRRPCERPPLLSVDQLRTFLWPQG